MNLYRERIVWLAYLLIGLILLLGNNEQRASKANLLSSTVYYPLITNVNYIEELFHVRRRNLFLTEKLAEVSILNNTLVNDMAHLQSTLSLSTQDDFQHGQPIGFTVSSIVSYQGSFTNRTLVLDKGYQDGIKASFPVISEKGVVGKVLSVFPKHAIVLPITNPLFKLGVITENSAIQGLLEADISGNIYMMMIPPGSHINVGDVVMTSSVSTVFPRGYPVGTVSRMIKTPEDVYLRAVVQPFIQVNNLEQVIVLFYEKELPVE